MKESRLLEGKPPDAGRRESPAVLLRLVPRTNVRMVMVPEDEWREMRAAFREWQAVRTGCPMARRLLEEG